MQNCGSSPQKLSLRSFMPIIPLLCSLCFLFLACRQQSVLVLIDEVYQTLDPDAVKTLQRLSSNLEILEIDLISSKLYQILQEKQPQRLFLSPLFQSELATIVQEFPDTTVLFAGPPIELKVPNLHNAIFTLERAAAQSGNLIRQHLEKRPDSDAGLIAIIGSTTFAPDEVAAFKAGLGPNFTGDERILYIQTGETYSADLARKYLAMDIIAAWLAVPAGQMVQYRETMLDAAAFTVASAPFIYSFFSSTDVILTWDLPGAFSKLLASPLPPEGSVMQLDWKIRRRVNK